MTNRILIILVLMSLSSLLINIGILTYLTNKTPVVVEITSPQPVSNYDYVAPALFDEEEKSK